MLTGSGNRTGLDLGPEPDAPLVSYPSGPVAPPPPIPVASGPTGPRRKTFTIPLLPASLNSVSLLATTGAANSAKYLRSENTSRIESVLSDVETKYLEFQAEGVQESLVRSIEEATRQSEIAKIAQKRAEEEIQLAQSALQERSGIVQESIAELDLTQKAYEEAETKVKDAKTQLLSLEQKRSAYRDDLDKLQQQQQAFTKAEQELLAAKGGKESSETKVSNARLAVETARSELTRAQALNATLLKDIESFEQLKTTLTTLQQTASSSAATTEEKARALELAQAHFANLQDKLSSAQARKEEFDTEITEYETLTSVTQARKEEYETTQSDLARLDAAYKAATEVYAKAQQENRTAQKLKADLEQDTELHATLNGAKTQIAEYLRTAQARTQTLQTSIQQLESQLVERQGQTVQAKQLQSNLRSEIPVLEDINRELQTVKTRVMEKLRILSYREHQLRQMEDIKTQKEADNATALQTIGDFTVLRDQILQDISDVESLRIAYEQAEAAYAEKDRLVLEASPNYEVLTTIEKDVSELQPAFDQAHKVFVDTDTLYQAKKAVADTARSNYSTLQGRIARFTKIRYEEIPNSSSNLSNLTAQSNAARTLHTNAVYAAGVEEYFRRGSVADYNATVLTDISNSFWRAPRNLNSNTIFWRGMVQSNLTSNVDSNARNLLAGQGILTQSNLSNAQKLFNDDWGKFWNSASTNGIRYENNSNAYLTAALDISRNMLWSTDPAKLSLKSNVSTMRSQLLSSLNIYSAPGVSNLLQPPGIDSLTVIRGVWSNVDADYTKHTQTTGTFRNNDSEYAASLLDISRNQLWGGQFLMSNIKPAESTFVGFMTRTSNVDQRLMTVLQSSNLSNAAALLSNLVIASNDAAGYRTSNIPGGSLADPGYDWYVHCQNRVNDLSRNHLYGGRFLLSNMMTLRATLGRLTNTNSNILNFGPEITSNEVTLSNFFNLAKQDYDTLFRTSQGDPTLNGWLRGSSNDYTNVIVQTSNELAGNSVLGYSNQQTFRTMLSNELGVNREVLPAVRNNLANLSNWTAANLSNYFVLSQQAMRDFANSTEFRKWNFEGLGESYLNTPGYDNRLTDLSNQLWRAPTNKMSNVMNFRTIFQNTIAKSNVLAQVRSMVAGSNINSFITLSNTSNTAKQDYDSWNNRSDTSQRVRAYYIDNAGGYAVGLQAMSGEIVSYTRELSNFQRELAVLESNLSVRSNDYVTKLAAFNATTAPYTAAYNDYTNTFNSTDGNARSGDQGTLSNIVATQSNIVRTLQPEIIALSNELSNLNAQRTKDYNDYIRFNSQTSGFRAYYDQLKGWASHEGITQANRYISGDLQGRRYRDPPMVVTHPSATSLLGKKYSDMAQYHKDLGGQHSSNANVEYTMTRNGCCSLKDTDDKQKSYLALDAQIAPKTALLNQKLPPYQTALRLFTQASTLLPKLNTLKTLEADRNTKNTLQTQALQAYNPVLTDTTNKRKQTSDKQTQLTTVQNDYARMIIMNEKYDVLRKLAQLMPHQKDSEDLFERFRVTTRMRHLVRIQSILDNFQRAQLEVESREKRMRVILRLRDLFNVQDFLFKLANAQWDYNRYKQALDRIVVYRDKVGAREFLGNLHNFVSKAQTSLTQFMNFTASLSKMRQRIQVLNYQNRLEQMIDRDWQYRNALTAFDKISMNFHIGQYLNFYNQLLNEQRRYALGLQYREMIKKAEDFGPRIQAEINGKPLLENEAYAIVNATRAFQKSIKGIDFTPWAPSSILYQEFTTRWALPQNNDFLKVLNEQLGVQLLPPLQRAEAEELAAFTPRVRAVEALSPFVRRIQVHLDSIGKAFRVNILDTTTGPQTATIVNPTPKGPADSPMIDVTNPVASTSRGPVFLGPYTGEGAKYRPYWTTELSGPASGPSGAFVPWGPPFGPVLVANLLGYTTKLRVAQNSNRASLEQDRIAADRTRLQRYETYMAKQDTLNEKLNTIQRVYIPKMRSRAPASSTQQGGGSGAMSGPRIPLGPRIQLTSEGPMFEDTINLPSVVIGLEAWQMETERALEVAEVARFEKEQVRDQAKFEFETVTEDMEQVLTDKKEFLEKLFETYGSTQSLIQQISGPFAATSGPEVQTLLIPVPPLLEIKDLEYSGAIPTDKWRGSDVQNLERQATTTQEPVSLLMSMSSSGPSAPAVPPAASPTTTTTVPLPFEESGATGADLESESSNAGDLNTSFTQEGGGTVGSLVDRITQLESQLPALFRAVREFVDRSARANTGSQALLSETRAELETLQRVIETKQEDLKKAEEAVTQQFQKIQATYKPTPDAVIQIALTKQEAAAKAQAEERDAQGDLQSFRSNVTSAEEEYRDAVAKQLEKEAEISQSFSDILSTGGASGPTASGPQASLTAIRQAFTTLLEDSQRILRENEAVVASLGTNASSSDQQTKALAANIRSLQEQLSGHINTMITRFGPTVVAEITGDIVLSSASGPAETLVPSQMEGGASGARGPTLSSLVAAEEAFQAAERVLRELSAESSGYADRVKNLTENAKRAEDTVKSTQDMIRTTYLGKTIEQIGQDLVAAQKEVATAIARAAAAQEEVKAIESRLKLAEEDKIAAQQSLGIAEQAKILAMGEVTARGLLVRSSELTADAARSQIFQKLQSDREAESRARALEQQRLAQEEIEQLALEEEEERLFTMKQAQLEEERERALLEESAAIATAMELQARLELEASSAEYLYASGVAAEERARLEAKMRAEAEAAAKAIEDARLERIRLEEEQRRQLEASAAIVEQKRLADLRAAEESRARVEFEASAARAYQEAIEEAKRVAAAAAEARRKAEEEAAAAKAEADRKAAEELAILRAKELQELYLAATQTTTVPISTTANAFASRNSTVKSETEMATEEQELGAAIETEQPLILQAVTSVKV
jgi:hypothetical protein